MDWANLLRLMTYIITFGAIFKGTDSFSKGDYSKGLREIMAFGVIPLSLSAAIRHIALSGSIIKGGRFFEFEAGGTNLALAVAAFVSLMKKMNNEAMGLIFLIYSIYLLMGSIAWYLYQPKGSIILWLLKFWSIGGAFAYFAYIGLTH